MTLELGMKHQGIELYNVCINHDPDMTLTYFTGKSKYVSYAFEWGKVLKCHLQGKAFMKWVNELDIEYSERNLDPGWGLPQPRGNTHACNHNMANQSQMLKEAYV